MWTVGIDKEQISTTSPPARPNENIEADRIKRPEEHDRYHERQKQDDEGNYPPALDLPRDFHIFSNVRDHQQPLDSGATSCDSRNRDRSPEGTAVWWIAWFGFIFWILCRGCFREEALPTGDYHWHGRGCLREQNNGLREL